MGLILNDICGEKNYLIHCGAERKKKKKKCQNICYNQYDLVGFMAWQGVYDECLISLPNLKRDLGWSLDLAKYLTRS